MSKQNPWERPSFFKVMIGPDFTKTLRVPPQFKKHLGDNPGTEAVLRRPGNRQWAVVLRNVDGDLYFQEGWDDFVEDNSISTGEFLVFFYTGGGGFDVAAYGTSGCEKEVFPPLREVKVEMGIVVEEKALPVVVGKKRCRKKKDQEKASPASARSRKRRRGADWKRNKLCYKIMRTMKPMNGEDEKVLKAACTFKTIHPHFIATCRASRSTFMPIPAELDRLYSLGEKSAIILRDEQGRMWPLKVSSWRDGRRCLSSGWSLVYKKNSLKEGDACLLEFVQEGNGINLHVFRANEYKSVSGKRLLSSAEKERVLKEVNSFKTRHPKFTVVWRLSLLYHVSIPRKVVKEIDLKGSQHAILLDPNGRSWPVEIICRLHGAVELGVGWNNFVRGNKLEAGDACVLEFIRAPEQFQIQVHIFRGREASAATTNTSTALALALVEQSPDWKSEILTS
ncbi:B3 domain-containing protein-like isoform X2 [Iris pallida]|uniref:B3 domain-containing protein-like isoform X2 n=1 Tax=Iris pallida TaxID=29817 RepID=A0AAX6HUC2_IRIPA|nr:B3 domain-containing protein-like isoform X2 [Iris pallida]